MQFCRPAVRWARACGMLASNRHQEIQCQLALYTVPVGIVYSPSWHFVQCQLAFYTVPVGISYSASWHFIQCQLAFYAVPVGILYSASWHSPLSNNSASGMSSGYCGSVRSINWGMKSVTKHSWGRIDSMKCKIVLLVVH